MEPVVITKNWKGHSATPIDVLRNASNDREIVTETSELGTVIRVPFETTVSERMLLKHGESKRRLERKAFTFIWRMASFMSSWFDPHRQILKAADEYLQHNNVDGIIASGEPFILFRYCFLLHKKHNVPWIADYRDGWKLNYVMRQSKDPLRKVLNAWEFMFEKKYLRTVSCIVSIDPILGKALSELHNKKARVVYNGFDGFYEGPRNNVSSELPLVINHTGTLTPGQRVETMLQAIKELLEEKKIESQEIKLQFIGLDYFPLQCQRVKSFDINVTQCIVTSPRMPREDVLQLNTAADYLVTFTEEKYSMINAKTYDYLAVKRPVLVVPSDNDLLSNLVHDLNAGESLSDVEHIKSFLHQAVLRKRRSQPIEAYPLNEEKAMFYTRKNQTGRLAEVVRQCFASR